MKSDPNQIPEWHEAGNGKALVLLHGFGGTWRNWKPLLPLLEPHYRVLAPTLPGHTGGIALTKPASPVSISEALAEQLKAKGIRDAHFVGVSLGGWAVFEMARFGLARSALGLSPAGAWRDDHAMVDFMRKARPSFKVLRRAAPLLKLAMGSAMLRRRLLANGMEHGERVSAADARDTLDRLRRMTIADEYLDEHLRPMNPLPASCKTALRVAWGGSDKVLPFAQFGQPLLDLLGLKSHVTLHGCGHDPVYDDPQAVATTILDFARSVDAEWSGPSSSA